VTWATAEYKSRSLMTEHLHGKGEWDRKNARQPEGPTGRQEKPPAELGRGG